MAARLDASARTEWLAGDSANDTASESAEGAEGAAGAAGAADEGALALQAWADARATEIGVVAQALDADGTMLDRALAIVRDFIIERGLIIFGGLAIDYALRTKGASIYPEAQRPDFDFLSPRNVEDAIDLADRLHVAGFVNVGAVRGIHVQTMRVRSDFIWVADVGHVPTSVFEAIPTFIYRGMRVVHPDFQRMDIHLAFCFPFNGPPREDVFHRWRKDLARFNLLEQYFPINAPMRGPRGACAAHRAALAVNIAPAGGGPAVAIHGFAAYAALRAALDALGRAVGAAPRVEAPRLAMRLVGPCELEVEIPTDAETAEISFASPEPEKIVEGLGVQKYAPYLDVCPETFACTAGKAVVYSTASRLLGVSTALVGSTAVCIVSPQYLLLWFLYRAHRATGRVRETYREYYTHTIEIIDAADALFAGLLDAARDDAEREAALDAFAASPFAPSVTTMGTTNHSAAYMIKMATSAAALRDVPPAALGLAADLAARLDGLPHNYYPSTAKASPLAATDGVFDYSASALFRRGGEALP